MKKITYQIQLNKSGDQFIYDKRSEIPIVDSRILLDIQFFNNDKTVFQSFIESGGQEKKYRVLVIKNCVMVFKGIEQYLFRC